MTQQQKLHAVETAIRKALPRLMEVSEGCKILEKGKAEENYSVILAAGMHYKIYTPFGDKFYLNEIESEEDLLTKYEILGHDILLSDVLEWLGTLFHFSIDHKGIIYKEFDYYFEGGLDRDYTEVAKVDFSKPRLADQSEELWNFLYNLL